MPLFRFLLIVWSLGLPGPALAQDRVWTFEARLDGRPIGEHTFRVSQSGAETVVDSRAAFDVRILGFSLYTYDHRAKERWKAGCLAELESHTNDNGTVEHVTGTLEADGFVVTRGATRNVLPPCTMTFAYWNPDMRRQDRLLNPQTGDYLDVRISAGESSLVEDGVQMIEAKRFVLRGKDLEIDLWYAAGDDRWLALDSTTTRGSLLTYRIVSPTAAARAR